MAKHDILILMPLILLGLLFLRGTNAFFNDTATASSNTFTAAAEFPSATPTGSENPPATSPSGHLVINEVFQSASNSAEWVELYNPTDSSIDVTGWKIADTLDTDIVPTSPSIPSGGFAVIVVSTSTVSGIPGSAITIHLAGATIGSGLNAIGDSVHLLMPDNAQVDAMSFGSDTSVFSLPSNPTSSQTFRRIPNGIDTDTAGDWTVGTPSIGESN